MSQREIVRDIGWSVQRERKGASLTQEALADRASVHVRTIRRLEQGISAPSLEDLEKIAVALGSSLYSLFFYASKHPKYDGDKDAEIRKIEYILRRHTTGELKLLRSILRDIFEIQRLKIR